MYGLYFWYNQTIREYKTSLQSGGVDDEIFRIFSQMDGLASYITELIKENPTTKIMNNLPEYGGTFSGTGGHMFPYEGEFTIERPLNANELVELEEMVRKNITQEKNVRDLEIARVCLGKEK